jgi:hypothetical protein
MSKGWSKVVPCDINGLPLGFSMLAYDYVSQARATLTDTWSFYSGGSGGTLVATITIAYTDASKAVIANVAKV